MPLSIKDPEADRLARELAQATGESITKAVTIALKERLRKVKARRRGRCLADELDEVAKQCASLPMRDRRTPEEVIGYDDRGLPT